MEQCRYGVVIVTRVTVLTSHFLRAMLNVPFQAASR
jgi:hypothetical protein